MDKFRTISRWDGLVHYTYQREQSVDEAGLEFLEQKGLYGKKIEEIELSGPVSFRGRAGKYKCRGNLKYSIKTYDESVLGGFKILALNDGKGTASIHRGLLEIDLDAGVYSFYLAPGDEEGVPVRSLWQQNISETIHKEMEGAGRIKTFSDAVNPGLWDDVMGWFPQQNWNEDDRYQLLVQAVGIPLPAFSANLTGSITSQDGSVVTWQFVANGVVEPEFATDSENWMHFHPKSAVEYEGYTAFWDEVREGEGAEEIKRSSRAMVSSSARDQARIFLVKRGDNGQSGPKVADRDSLVATSIPLEKQFSSDNEKAFRFSADRSLEAESRENQALIREQEVYSTLKHLFVNPGITEEKTGLENTIREYRLLFSGVQIDGDVTTISLAGDFSAEEADDRLRIIGQLRETARQFPGVEKVSILLNRESF